MPSPAERARVQVMLNDLLNRLKSADAQRRRDAQSDAREALSRAANERALARHGRPLTHWLERHEAEREAQDEALAKMLQRA